ncbi:MAG: NCS2 family permease [Lachnospiraceae bacterium]|nr:NCS2 family permease [Lachnospiraceae bacterium]
MENFFKLKEKNTTVKTEVLGGLTTFMTMAYILAVNPSILSSTGMDEEAVMIATCLASFIGTLAMAFLANLPFALAPGMGLNAYFAFSVCLGMGYSWQVALFAVFVEGVIFILLTLTNVREAIFNAIPMCLKKGVGAGIGLFVAFIGLQDAKLVVKSDSTLVTNVSFRNMWHTAGIVALVALIGVLLIVILEYKRVPGGILIGIVVTWVLDMILETAGVYVPDSKAGFNSVIPSMHMTNFASLGKTFGAAFDFGAFGDVKIMDFIVIMFSFLFVDIFDTIGTLIGVSDRAGMLDKDGKLPQIKPALLADAIATCAGAILGTSTTTTFVESSAGVGAGARTGLASVVTGLMFLIAIFFAPIFTKIPTFAIAPALIYVGFLMLSAIIDVDFKNLRQGVPAFLTVLCMPLMYSISEGIAVGIISYVVINLIANAMTKNKEDREPVTPLMIVLAIIFVLKYALL